VTFVVQNKKFDFLAIAFAEIEKKCFPQVVEG
jgi:hypothetical protein